VADSSDDLKARRKAAAAESTRWLTGRRPSVADTLRRLADVATDEQRDGYGEGGEVAQLESEVAELLGKPAAVFMPTGIAAQQSVLRVFADRAGTQRVAVHGLSHLLLHELNALEEVHRLRIERLTSEPRWPPFRAHSRP
jgi:threonine aldolase